MTTEKHPGRSKNSKFGDVFGDTFGDVKQNSPEAKPLGCEHLVGVRRFELLTSSVSGKRSPPELNARSRVRKCARDNITEPELGGKNIFKNRLHCGLVRKSRSPPAGDRLRSNYRQSVDRFVARFQESMCWLRRLAHDCTRRVPLFE